jgi:hypothetical protein
MLCLKSTTFVDRLRQPAPSTIENLQQNAASLTACRRLHHDHLPFRVMCQVIVQKDKIITVIHHEAVKRHCMSCTSKAHLHVPENLGHNIPSF